MSQMLVHFHWCSDACRAKSCDFTSHHDLLCSDTPRDKAEQTRARAEVVVLFGWNNDGSQKIGGGPRKKPPKRTCHGCGLAEMPVDAAAAGVDVARFTQCRHCRKGSIKLS